MAAGTANITYTLGGGCRVTAVATVNAVPPAISGTLTICIGATSSLSNAVSGGTWASNNTSIATADAASGVITAVANGTTAITYTAPTGCIRIAVATVNPLPAPITGVTTVCVGATTVLSCPTPGGVSWTSADPSIATIGASSGVVTGISAGSSAVAVTYTLSSGCVRSTTVTVNALPAAITGSHTACVGSATTLASATTGGTWTSSNAGIASVGSATGAVTGIAAGTVNVTYTIPTSCRVTYSVTVNPIAVITGPASVCAGANITLGNASAGGTWSSNDAALATVGSSNGVVSGLSAGTVGIVYTLPSGCTRTASITVKALPGSILGTRIVCAGATTSLSNATTGGTWACTPTSIATVASTTGVVTGVAAGVANVTYTPAGGCSVAAQVTTNPLPPASTGATGVCIGASSTLSNTAPAGTWASSNTALATVGSATGIISGVASGVVAISYIVPTGCIRSMNVSVNSLPSAITGTLVTCVGGTTALSNATSGGVSWTSSNIAVATIGSASGLVTGVAAGTAAVTYTVSSGCKATAVVTVNASASAGTISGSTGVCAGATTVLSSTVAGGTWSSANNAIATVNSAGVVTGVANGNTAISYTVTTSCGTASATAAVTVNPLPSTVSGSSSVCVGSTIALSASVTGGTWSSSNTSVATIGSNTGTVTAVTAGTAIMTYSTGSGCVVTTLVTANPMPAAITGSTIMCTSPITLSDAVSGGTWASSDITVASVTSSGVVTGYGPGTATVTYTLPGGCFVTADVTNPLAAVTGTPNTSVGQSTMLADSTAGGTWSSSDNAIATVDASGYVTGVAVGSALISYTLGSGCSRNMLITIYPAIEGITQVCIGQTTTLTHPMPGGLWSAYASTVVAGPSGSGIVTGVTTGAFVITYSLPSGNKIYTTVTVNALPSNITGTARVCPGTSTTLSNTTASGAWSVADTLIATVNASGVVTGGAAGYTSVNYTISGTGCMRSVTFTVNPLPAAITGTATVCVGSISTLYNATGSAVGFSGSNAAIANVNSQGYITGVSAGTITATYTLGTGCTTTTTVTVNPQPAAITGYAKVCPGTATTLSSATPGAVWSSATPGMASVDADGVVTGVTAGTGTISYTYAATGCARFAYVTVNNAPAAIAGNPNACFGGTTTLYNAGGGVWTSSDATVASIGSVTGIVTGNTVGTATITYLVTSIGSGCISTVNVAVNTTPDAGSIAGPATLVGTASISLTASVAGGNWASSNTGVATVAAPAGSSASTVTGVAAGATVITYAVNNGCGMAVVTRSVSVTASRDGNSTVAVTDNAEYVIYPNPSNGVFFVKGNTGSVANEELTLEVTDMLGQVVYSGGIKSVGGVINEQVAITNSIANGMYIINLRKGNENSVFPIMIKQ